MCSKARGQKEAGQGSKPRAAGLLPAAHTSPFAAVQPTSGFSSVSDERQGAEGSISLERVQGSQHLPSSLRKN